MDSIHRDYALFDQIVRRCNRAPRVAILMSGTGSNARNILKNWQKYRNIDFVAIATDRPACHTALIARNHGLHYILPHNWDKKPFDREAFFQILAVRLRTLHVNLLVYAGFMKVTPEEFLTEFPGINIHPADLTIAREDGRPRYTGLDAVARAIRAGESYIASTVHVVEENADCGLVIAVSKHVPLPTECPPGPHELQEELKRTGEHTLYPQVLALLSRSKITRDMLPLRAEQQDLDALLH